MNLIPWDPWAELDRLRAETDRRWSDFFAKLGKSDPRHSTIAFLPDADLVETASEYWLYLSMPGMVEEDIDIDIGVQSLTVRGERQSPYDASRAGSSIREWRYGYFERTFRFPRGLQASSVRAGYEAGVLTIVIGKLPEERAGASGSR